jgi:hypothetical protein
MTAVKELPTVEVGKSTNERKAALERAVADLKAEGHVVETRPDYQKVLVGHNEFRRVLVRRQWGIRRRHELVDVDKKGRISVRKV